MEYITREDLTTLGIELPEEQIAEFLQHANDTLAERIGAEITESLTDEEVSQMIEVQELGDETALQAWLIEKVPELKEIVQDEVDIFIAEIAA